VAYETEIQQVADEQSLPFALLKAVCAVESSFNPYAIRYEPGYRWLVGTEATLTATERTAQMMSWGLLQVMGAVAREHGFTESLPMLCIPLVGLRYGGLHLAKYKARYGTWVDTIASYNAGAPRLIQGKYVNQDYVDKVVTAWRGYDASAEV
jgi:soluble lytic murein transglycosylase-like protein